MRTSDQLCRFTFDQTPIRGELVHLDASVRNVLANHDYPERVALLIGEFMAAAALLSATLKFEGSLIIQVSSKGPVPMLMAECRNQRFLRAIASYESGVDTATHLLQQGRLAITVERSDGERYQSIILLDNDNLSAALEQYFLQSEQLRTRIWLASKDAQAAGLFLQTMPTTSDGVSLAEQTDDWERLEILSDTITTGEMLELDFPTILRRLYHQEEVRLHPSVDLEFQCSCSRQRSAHSLLSIGETEARLALKNSGDAIHIDCQFCNAQYRFTGTDIDALFSTQVN